MNKSVNIVPDHKSAQSHGWTMDDLMRWDQDIRVHVDEMQLDCYPQEFEVCDHDQMLALMAYAGMPSHYPHWSFGKSYEVQKTMYDHGLSGLPYEMVINANPSIAYLMRDNSLLLQILTMAHVYGHNDFFKNNFTFSFYQADRVVESFKAHADRIRYYAEQPSIGIDAVEEILDAAHALAFQCHRNPAIKKRTQQEQREAILRKAIKPKTSYDAIHPSEDISIPDLDRIPLEPEDDILLFIRDHNPRLAEWQKDILTIVHDRTRYFLPQIETKIMNEGWACYTHRAIMNKLGLGTDLFMEFLVRHNQVVRPILGQVNPYHLGLTLWDDIIRRHTDEKATEDDIIHMDPRETKDILFELRASDRDTSFLRRFLTHDVMEKLDMFEYRKRHDKAVAVTHTSTEENWRHVKETLIRNTGMNSIPIIKIIDADMSGSREMMLAHEFDGRELEKQAAEQTLRYIQTLWGRTVHLSCSLAGHPVIYTCNGDKVTVENVKQKEEDIETNPASHI